MTSAWRPIDSMLKRPSSPFWRRNSRIWVLNCSKMKTGATMRFAMPSKPVGMPVFHEGGDGLGSAIATAGKTTTAACRKACIATRWPFGLPFVSPRQYAVTPLEMLVRNDRLSRKYLSNLQKDRTAPLRKDLQQTKHSTIRRQASEPVLCDLPKSRAICCQVRTAL